jgi:hypothetical protein
MEKNLAEIVLPNHLIMHIDAKYMNAESQDMTELISTDFEPFFVGMRHFISYPIDGGADGAVKKNGL